MGGVSQIEAEYSVFECAFKHGPYLIYHLISGVDLPIKTQDYIHKFIMKHPHTEFLSIQFDDETNHNIELKTRYYHFLIRYARHPNFRIRKIAAYIRSYSIRFQQLIGVKRHYPMKLYKGANWCSITNELLEYILSKKNDVLSMFRHTFCCDEIFLQTLVWNSGFRTHVYHYQGKYSSLREIDWGKGNPYTWGADSQELSKEHDLSTLVKSKNLFARKFSMRYDWIIKEVESII